MKLLYCYAKFFDANGNITKLRGLDSIELNFSAQYTFSYNENQTTDKARDIAGFAI